MEIAIIYIWTMLLTGVIGLGTKPKGEIYEMDFINTNTKGNGNSTIYYNHTRIDAISYHYLHNILSY